MRLTRLEIQTLPGIEPGFVLDEIGSGSNLVTGPNATGKSSLIRTLSFLVGGSRPDDPPALALSAVFEADDGRWTVRRTGREIVWERDGSPAERPRFPDHDQLHCYWLSVEDLLQVVDERNDDLVDELRRSLSGGYDLNALRSTAPYKLGAQHGSSQAKGLRTAEKALRDVEVSYDKLQHEEGRIPKLEEAVQAARDAERNARRLQEALDLLAASNTRREIEAGLAAFPDQMEMLRGDEFDRLDKLDSKRGELQNGLAEQARLKEEAASRLEETGLAKARPQSSDLQVCLDDLVEAGRLKDQRDQKQQESEKATAAEDQALGNLGGDTMVPHLDPDSVSRAETLATELQATERSQRDLQHQLEGVGNAPDQASIDRLLKAAEALRAWLASDGETSAGRLRLAIFTAIAGGLLAAGTAIFAQAWLAALGGAISLAGAVWALFEMRGTDHTQARRQFEQCGLEGPKSWQREAVEERLQAIEAKRSDLLQDIFRSRKAEEVRQTLARVDQELKELQEQKATMAAELGFDPELTATSLDRFVRLVQAYEEAHQERETARLAIERLEGEIGATTDKVRAFLETWKALPGKDEGLAALRIALESLRQRGEDAEVAERDAREAERELLRLEKDLEGLGADEATLFTNAGLESGDRQELKLRCGQLEAWKEKQGQLNASRVVEVERRKALEAEETLLARVEADERESLERDLEKSEVEAETLEQLRDELAAIRTRLEEAGLDNRLEAAQAEVDKCTAALEDKYQEALFSDAGNFLLDSVQREFHIEHEPEVLRDARERFRRFTHNAFDLELDETSGFMARDLKQEALRSLFELSSATRMQLLLAMRLAWTRNLEKGREALPLFLDEALTTSDEDRFSQVVASLDELAREEGRQVFYLSARRGEIAMWKRATGSSPHHIDLAAVRFPRKDATPADYILPEVDRLPAPNGTSPEDYAAELGIPPIDPRQPAGSVHLFHLLRDDLDLLHGLMENWRITTLGQLESLLPSPVATHAIPDAGARKLVESRCAITRAWITAWREGRGKPVDRAAIERSDTVSATFVDRVVDLADSHDGDGDALITALRAGKLARFRESTADALSAWLESEGYIDPTEILPPEDRERRTLMDTADRATPEEIRQVVRWLEAG